MFHAERLYRFLLSVFCHASPAQCTRVICAGSAKSIRNGETRRDEDLLVVFNCTGNFHSCACFSLSPPLLSPLFPFFFPFFTRYNVLPDFISDCKMLAFARKIPRFSSLTYRRYFIRILTNKFVSSIRFPCR